jgi:hypothetical protein
MTSVHNKEKGKGHPLPSQEVSKGEQKYSSTLS